MPSLLLALATCLALTSISFGASAGDKALAESLFQAGRKLLAEGKAREACAKFAGSQEQDPSPGTLINLGKCNEEQGKTASAWAAYKEAEALAGNVNRPQQRAAAHEAAAALEPKLSKLQIDPPPERVEGLTVRRGGVEMGRSSLGVPVAVDPGEYEITASAPGHEAWTGSVTVAPGPGLTKIAVPVLARAAEPTPPDARPHAAAGTAPSAGSSPPDTASDTSEETQPTLGYLLMGGGAAVLLAGGVFGYLAKKQASDAEDDPTLCPGKRCTPAGRDEIDSAESKALISTLGVGVGAAALAVGVVLTLTGGSEGAGDAHPAAPAARLEPTVLPGGGSLSLTGAF